MTEVHRAVVCLNCEVYSWKQVGTTVLTIYNAISCLTYRRTLRIRCLDALGARWLITVELIVRGETMPWKFPG